MTEKQTEALERLNRGIEDSRAEVQRRTMSLAQDYFGDSAETLKQQIKDNRAALEGLPDQIPGGREEAFQMMFQELMDNYTAIEQSIGEAQTRVADLDTDNLRRQGEVDATDAARRDARELGIDLTEIEGTGSEGRITVDDVKEHAEKQRAGDQVADQAQDAAGRAADQVQEVAGGAAGQATNQAGQVAGRATDQIGQTAGQAQDLAGGAADQAQQTAGQATQQIQDTAVQGTDAVGGLTGGGQDGGGGPLGGVTDQVGQVAGQVQDAAGQAQDAAGGVTQQAQGATAQATEQVADRSSVKEQEIVASDAARREAREKGIDLSKIKGTGAEGRIVYWDVADLPSRKDSPAETADQAQQTVQGASDAAGQAASGIADQVDGAVGQVGGIADQVGDQAMSTADQARGAVQENGGEPRITKAARRKAEEMGRDLSQIQGSGAGGLITISDVVRG